MRRSRRSWAGRTSGPRPSTARRRHRQHGGAGPLRQRCTEAAVAQAAARGRDPLGLRDDRARGGVVRRDQHHREHRARRRPLRGERPQVVDLRRRRPALQDPHLHGQDGSAEPEPAPAAVHDPRADGRTGRARRAQRARVRLRRRAARPFRGRLRGRARARGQPAARRGPRLRDRAGPARPGRITTACARSVPPSVRSS